MKSKLLTATLIATSITAIAQNKPVEAKKELPATLTFTITQSEFLRIDTAIGFYSNAIDSKTQSANYMNALRSFIDQVNKQLVVKPVKKP